MSETVLFVLITRNDKQGSKKTQRVLLIQYSVEAYLNYYNEQLV